MKKIISFFNVTGKELGLRYLVLGGVIGCISGFVAIVFHQAIVELSSVLIVPFLSLSHKQGLNLLNVFYTIAIPSICGALVAYFTEKFAPEAEGHGVPEIMNSVVSNDGVIKPKVGLVKFLSSTLSISSGFSVGREGPTALIGATMGSWVGQILGLSRKRMKLAVGCGTAAGIAATFNAPLAGAAFALELIVGNLSIVYLSPIIFSAMMATVISRAISGNNHALFAEYEFILQHPWEIGLYCFLGVLVGLTGLVYTRTLYAFEEFVAEIKRPKWLKGAVGGSLIGIGILFIPEISGPNTWSTIKSFVSIDSQNLKEIVAAGLLIGVAKILFTSISLSTGASGGVFAPSLLIGGAIGGPYGVLVNHLYPGIADHPGGYALVAMGAIVAAITQAPMTAIIIIFELTNDYAIVLPLIMACGTSMAVYNRLQKGSIYTLKLLRKGIDLEWGKDVGVLQSIHVHEITKPEEDAFYPSTSYSDALSKMKKATRQTLPVINEDQKLVGIVTSARLLDQMNAQTDLVVEQIMDRKVSMVTPEQTLYDAFMTISKGDYSYLPVVKSLDNPILLGRLHRQDLLQLYQNQLRLRGIY